MHVSDLTLKDLGYVVAVARYTSFSLAAQHCAVSQPALSKQIKNIETLLGVALFERNKRQVLVTEPGKEFVEQSIRVLDEAEKLLQISVHHQGPLSGHFHLGAIASVCPYLLPRFVGELKTTYPALKLMVREGLTDGLIQELKQGKLDAVIAATTFEDDMLELQPLFFEPFLLAARKEKGQAFKAEIEVADIDPEKLLLLEDGHCLKDQTMELCKLRDQSSEMNFKATSLETLLQMTAGGLGLAVIPMLAKPTGSKLSEDLVFSAFKNKAGGRTLALYYRKSYPWPQNMKLLAQFIQHYLPPTVTIFELGSDES